MEHLIELPLLDMQKDLKTRTQEGRRQVFDAIRRKWLVLQPEEHVRQLLLLYLVHQLGYSPIHIGIEKKLVVNTLTRRCDILVYSAEMAPWMLIECKAPAVPITQATFDQVARYNMPLQVPFLTVTNGLQTFCCALDYEQSSYTFLDTLPEFPKRRF